MQLSQWRTNKFITLNDLSYRMLNYYQQFLLTQKMKNRHGRLIFSDPVTKEFENYFQYIMPSKCGFHFLFCSAFILKFPGY